MKRLTYFLTISAVVLAFSLNAQVAINQDGSDANSNSILDVKDASNNAVFFIENTGDVGVGTPNPTEKLDIDGNVKFSGALMPNNDAGTSGQLLLSEGPGTAATWGAQMLNRSETTAIGKFYVGPFDIDASINLTLTVTDTNCVQTSTCFMTWVGDLPTGYNYSNILTSYEAQDGQWIFYFRNLYSLTDFINMQFSFVAFY